MKNHQIRARRDEGSAVSAPEYAVNCLNVDIILAKGRSDVHELSVRLYTSAYRLMGVAARQASSSKAIRTWHFEVSSSDAWTGGTYRAFVYVNGVPSWKAELFLYTGEGIDSSARLESLEPSSPEMLFAGRLAFRSWWPVLEGFHLDEDFIVRFMEQIRLFTQNIETKTWASVPPLQVTGDADWAERFASLVLVPCVKEEWGKECVLTEVSGADDDMLSLHLLERVCYLVGAHIAPDTVFVFHGATLTMEWLNADYYPYFSLFENEDTCFRLPETLLTERKTEPKGFSPDETEMPEAAEVQDEERKPALQRLEEMVGLSRVKDELCEACAMALFTRRRKELGLEVSAENRNHFLFLGSPGTGKTTVARLIGEIYHEMGLLSRGHTVETNRAKLIGEFIGQTEQKTCAAIAEARGGVLFIDEAYTLVHEDDSRDFGKEVIHALMTVLSEPNPDLIVILAGYEMQMQALFRLNPGLDSRFPLRLHFDDFTSDELTEMARHLLAERNFELSEAADVRLAKLIEKAVLHKDEHFGNGRWVHNLVEHGILKCMAKRVMALPLSTESSELFRWIEETDVAGAEPAFLYENAPKVALARRIGFTA